MRDVLWHYLWCLFELDEIMVSFGVETLYTNMPITDALLVIKTFWTMTPLSKIEQTCCLTRY